MFYSTLQEGLCYVNSYDVLSYYCNIEKCYLVFFNVSVILPSIYNNTINNDTISWTNGFRMIVVQALSTSEVIAAEASFAINGTYPCFLDISGMDTEKIFWSKPLLSISIFITVLAAVACLSCIFMTMPLIVGTKLQNFFLKFTMSQRGKRFL